MSFIEPNFNMNKPKLVDNKIIKKIKKKKIELKKNSLPNNVKNICFSFIKKNLGIIFIFVFLAIFLYLRYTDVKEKRKKIPKLN